VKSALLVVALLVAGCSAPNEDSHVHRSGTETIAAGDSVFATLYASKGDNLVWQWHTNGPELEFSFDLKGEGHQFTFTKTTDHQANGPDPMPVPEDQVVTFQWKNVSSSDAALTYDVKISGF
jgi:hypothetical protein